jgi:hypothetical protein
MAETTGAARAATLKGTVNVRVTEHVTLENLHNIITHIAGMTGCRTCGLLGVDLILGGDPAELQQVAKLPGVQSTSLRA